MNSFQDALHKAGIATNQSAGYDKKKAGSFTLEMKLYELESHISAIERVYQKYLVVEGEDKFDLVDSLANRYGYMVIAFQDIITTISRITGKANADEMYSIRRAISEFQVLFEEEVKAQSLDDAVVSMADRNEIVHIYENYQGNMETVLKNIGTYKSEYEIIKKLLWNYCKKSHILQREN